MGLRISARIIVLAFGILCFPIASSQVELNLDYGAIDSIFSDWTADKPGGVVGIFDNGRQIYVNAFGLADLESRRPVTLDTQFNVASIAKTFTAFGILLLEEQRQISLDEDIRNYLPEMPDFGESITISDLLHHFSGIRNWSTLFALKGMSGESIDHQQVFELLKKQTALNHSPGIRETYSNSNFYLLARIIENVTGQSFSEFMEANIFSPLGMDSTYIYDALSDNPETLAQGYYVSQGENFVEDMPQHNVYGSSNLITTLNDFALWEANLASPTVGTPELVDKLYERGVLDSGAISRFAKGTGYSNVLGISTRGMSGTTPGYTSSHNQHPELGITVVIMTNATNDLYTPYIDIMQLCCQRAIAQGSELLENYSQRFTKLSDEALQEFVGAYKTDEGNDVLNVYSNDAGNLIATGFEFTFVMKPIDSSVFESVSPINNSRISFGTSSEDDQTLTVHRNNIESFQATMIPEIELSSEYLEQFTGTYRSAELDSSFELVLRDGTLHRTGEGFPDRRLNGQYLDLFIAEGNTGNHLFERDEEGRISGFRISVAGVNNLFYEKLIQP